MKVGLKVNLKVRAASGRNEVIVKGTVFDDSKAEMPTFVQANIEHFKILDATVTVRDEVKEPVKVPAKTEEVKTEEVKTEEVKAPAETEEVKTEEVKANDAGGAGPAGAEIKPVRRRSPTQK